MIQPLIEKYIPDISVAHVAAWQKAYRGILSDEQLDNLQVENFIKGWKHNIFKKGRTNLIWVTENDKAVGFVSFGKPYDENEKIQAEIYGFYVHPDFWKKRIGYQLMKNAVLKISKQENFNGVILWVMTKNRASRNFYERFGFSQTKETKISKRNGEEFEEMKYILVRSRKHEA